MTDKPHTGRPIPIQTEWHAYYTEKRIVHQWMQVHLLKDLPVRRVLEIGPYLGLVTAMLRNAGYLPVTCDIAEQADDSRAGAAGDHIRSDIRDLDSAAIKRRQIDAILCCETLEHLPYPDVGGVLARLAATEARYLILSVPFMGAQLTFDLYVNRHVIRTHTSAKKFFGLRRFPAPETEAWEPHKWEVGYRDRPLAEFRAMVERHYRILRTEFTGHCRSVFFLCENAARPPEA